MVADLALLTRPIRLALATLALAFGFTVCATPSGATLRSPGGALPACTIWGTSGADLLVGTSGDDVICGRAGNDVILGLSGDDVLLGGGGADRVIGGGGADELLGAGGSDRLAGGAGEDLLLGGAGVDRLAGAGGADRMAGGASEDQLRAGGSGDTCADDRSDTVTGACELDGEAPQLTVPIDPLVVGAGEDLVIEVHAADPSGLSASTPMWAFIGGTNGWVVNWCGFPVMAERVAGDALDGTYRITCPVPINAVNGSYGISVGVSDSLGNTNLSDLSKTTFSVVGGAGDAAPPEVEVLSANPVSAPSGGEADLQLRVHDETGLDGMSVYLMGQNGHFVDENFRTWVTGSYERLSGDAKDGTYRLRLDVSADLAPGVYELWIGRNDLLGNHIFERVPVGSGFASLVVTS